MEGGTQVGVYGVVQQLARGWRQCGKWPLGAVYIFQARNMPSFSHRIIMQGPLQHETVLWFSTIVSIQLNLLYDMYGKLPLKTAKALKCNQTQILHWAVAPGNIQLVGEMCVISWKHPLLAQEHKDRRLQSWVLFSIRWLQSEWALPEQRLGTINHDWSVLVCVAVWTHKSQDWMAWYDRKLLTTEVSVEFLRTSYLLNKQHNISVKSLPQVNRTPFFGGLISARLLF